MKVANRCRSSWITKGELAPGTQKNYYTTCRYVRLFLKEKYKTTDLYLEELNYKFIKNSEKFLKNRKLTDHKALRPEWCNEAHCAPTHDDQPCFLRRMDPKGSFQKFKARLEKTSGDT
ncbi:phage integrase SAM-like domain-containing protein [Cesiribacter sp. SM1]|uniref:phage integrase SAM-like domain-containing protein n=1 Tax=Cesiribacter sp. SM1 TaxID=2861196 RepID=UPI001CD206E0|nr:phage integrase SAM-like domain-containing protein [Cesiribacter sp. SM1]